MERKGGQEASLAKRPDQRRWRSSAGLRDPGRSSFAGPGAPLVWQAKAPRFCLARFDIPERSARRYSRLGTIVEFRGRMRYRVSTAEPRTARTVLQLLLRFSDAGLTRMCVKGAEAGVRKPSGEEAAGRPMGVSGRAALWGFRRRRHDDADCVAAMSAFR